MTDTELCKFCRRDKPKTEVTCGPTDDGPCPCCGLVVVAIAPDVREEPEETSEQE